MTSLQCGEEAAAGNATVRSHKDNAAAEVFAISSAALCAVKGTDYMQKAFVAAERT